MLVAVVSDSYDIFRACSELWGKRLKDKVLATGGTLVVRPDSGDPATVVVEVIRRSVEEPEIWMAPTGAGHWQVRDVFGHLIDTTETYFVGFDAARKGTNPPDSVPLRDMATHVDQGAQQFRTLDRTAVLDRLESAWTTCDAPGSRETPS